MKKFILKGKEFISKKLEELDFATEGVDFVDEQVPSRLREPLRVLQRTEIDLESNEPYETYFKSYPNHHISHFLLEKHQLLLAAQTPSPPYQLPLADKDTFVPKTDPQLQNQALLLREVIEQYDEGMGQIEQPIVCLAVIHFHHKRGTQVEYSYPHSKSVEGIHDLIVHHAMPDSSHNKEEDYNFFNFQTVVQGRRKMLFGVSYFKQIKVTQEMKLKDKEVTRSYVQKAIAVVSALPLFGYLRLRLTVTTKLFFENFSSYEVIDAAYRDLNKHVAQTWPQMVINQLYIGSDLRTIINLFGAVQFYQIWKAVLMQRRVVVFAHSSSSASSFILSLLSLFPGLSTFGVYSKPIGRYMQGLREYALPLRLFSSENFMGMSFHVQDFHLLSRFQKSSKGSFLLGTTNRLLKQANDFGVELLVNLQQCTLEKRKARLSWEPLTKKERTFISQIEAVVAVQKSGYIGSQDMIRNTFHSFLKTQLLDLMKGVKSFRNFAAACRDYQKTTRKNSGSSNGSKTSKGQEYELMQEQNQVQVQKGKNDFPPLIPAQVTNMPFANLLLCSSFSYFLQFHNNLLPEIADGAVFPSLLIDGFDYVYKINQSQFVSYNWNDKKLVFGKGKPRFFEGKEIKFVGGEANIVKSIFIGLIEEGKPSKNGFYLDKAEVYEGDFSTGVREGYGKLTNSVHKYIGFFHNDLYTGQGQLLSGKDIYVGEFKQGLRHGIGKNQGQFNYDGQWLNNKADGNGTLKLEGRQIIGHFQKGELNNQVEVTIRYESGAMYKGFASKGVPEGRGYLMDQEGKLFTGLFKDGEFYQEMEKARDSAAIEPSKFEKQPPFIQQVQEKQNILSLKSQPST